MIKKDLKSNKILSKQTKGELVDLGECEIRWK